MKEMNINGMGFVTKVSTADMANEIKDDFGVVYSYDGKRLLRCEDRTISQYTIKDDVEVICDGAFNGCTKLEKITLGENVMYIGEHAFENCNLVNLVIGNSVKYIGNFAFQDCWRLTKVFLASSVREINGTAFAYCNNLINFGIAEDNEHICIDEGVIYSKDMTKLMLVAEKSNVSESFKIPLSVTTIGDYAFYDCAKLLEIIGGKRIKSIGKAAFCGCSSLHKLTLPSTIVTIGYSEKNEEDAGEDVFKWCNQIESIYILCLPIENKNNVENRFKKLLPQKLHNKIEFIFRDENHEAI